MRNPIVRAKHYGQYIDASAAHIVTAVWVVVLVACVLGTSVASQRAVIAALRVTTSTRLPPAVVGLTVMAIGTDLPEIANSLVSAASGHGDVNVGDSVGSVVTQVTLVLGILCLVGREIDADRGFVLAVGSGAFFSTMAVLIMVQDGELSHLDGVLLITLWAGGSLLLGHEEMRTQKEVSEGTAGAAGDIASTLFWLGLVGAFAIGVLESFLRLAEAFGIPEFIGSFVALSIGTSLPELAVDWIAIKKGASSLAVGDVFGSSFVDASLSVGIGPAVFGSAVSDAVRPGVALAALGVLLATILATRAKRYNWRLGVPLLVVYLGIQSAVAFYPT